jgi:hypothetical protein
MFGAVKVLSAARTKPADPAEWGSIAFSAPFTGEIREESNRHPGLIGSGAFPLTRPGPGLRLRDARGMNNLPNPFSGALLTMLLLALALLIGLLLPVLVLTVQTGDRGTYGRA